MALKGVKRGLRSQVWKDRIGIAIKRTCQKKRERKAIMKTEFAERVKRFSDTELENIIQHNEEFVPDYLKAVKEEIKKRKEVKENNAE